MNRKPHGQRHPQSDARQGAALVVGLGISGNRPQPLEPFLSHLPAHAGLSLVLVQEPGQPGLDQNFLAQHSALQVVAPADGMRPEPNHIYVAAPGTALTLEAGAFKVAAAEPPSRIDDFFRSLAAEVGERAVAVLFRGTVQAVTAGLRAVKEHGGLTLIQAPDATGLDIVCENAIEAGLADHVLPPDQLAVRLIEHAGHAGAAERDGASLEIELSRELGKICACIREHTGHDFASYKEGTLLRRIRRRIQILQVPAVDAYLERLNGDADEAQQLVKDLLIGVTQFFRDPEHFEVLSRQVIPRLLQDRPSEQPVRIWVAGCASGEEAYSVAILVREHLERLGCERRVQIFATDLDMELLASARAGRYPLAIVDEVGPERLARFFVRKGQRYQAADELRELCIFSQHSLIRDPPFSQLDLICCRNVLIYFSAELQKKLRPLLHYALRPGGFLFLGPSECLSGTPELFETLDASSRIFRRKETVRRPAMDFPLAAREPGRPALTPPRAIGREPSTPSFRQQVSAAFERTVLEEYATPCAIVSHTGDLVLVAGRLDRYFRLPSGAVSTNLIDLVPAGLRVELRLALQTAASTRRRVVRDDIAVELDDGIHRVRLTVRPAPGAEADTGLLLLVLQDHAPLDTPDEPDELETSDALADQPVLERLESELRLTRAELKATVEDLESANEELKSANEELISTNEELQSANEELKASQEELQSLNEELETVNTELRQKVDALATANSDLQNLFASTEIATLFLDRELHILRFTPAATGLLRLVEGDVGRPIGDFALRFEGQDLVSAAREVLRTLTPVEQQVQTADGERWLILRLIPYRTLDNAIAGVVVTFVDITALKHSEEALRQTSERERFLAATIEHATTAFGAGYPDGRLLRFNRAFAELTGYSRQELEDSSLSWMQSLTPPEWREQEAEVLARAVRERAAVCYEKEYQRKDGSRVPIELNVQPVFDDRGRLLHYRAFITDISTRKQAEEALRQSEERLRLALRAAKAGTWEWDVRSNRNAWSEELWALYALPPDSRTPSYEAWLEAVHPDDREAAASAVREAAASGSELSMEWRVDTRGASERWLMSRGQPQRDAGGQVVRYLGIVLDITDRKQAEAALRRSEARWNTAIEQFAEGAVIATEDERIVYWNPAAQAMHAFTRPDEGLEPLEQTAASFELWTPDGLHRLELDEWPMRRIKRGEVIRDLELCVRRLDQDWEKVFSYSGAMVETAGGERLIFLSCSDLTELRHAERALMRSHEGLRRLADASLSVMEKTALDEMLQAIAEAALALTGARIATCGHGLVSGQAIVGGAARAPDAPACPPGEMFRLDRGGVHMALTEGAKSIRLSDAELRAHPKWWGLPAGHVPMRGLLGAPMRARSGETNGMILVTDKAQGDFSREDEALLGQLATVASLALQHVEARISLEESDRRKNHFLAMLGHELRNPLAPIRNSLDVIDQSPPDSELSNRAHAVIDRQVTHLTRLVDDLLDVTRISRGKIELKRERVDLCEMARRAAEDYRDAFAHGQLTLELELPDAPLWVSADRTRIAQIIGNLLNNCLKFTPPSGTAVISLEPKADLGQAVLSMRDTGIGIAPDMLPRVFEPFAQADTTLDRSRGGLGLGLATVKGLIELHGGTASAESAGLGAGSTLTVRLPLALAEPDPEPGRERPEGVEGGRRILVIEDNLDAAESLRLLLQLTGHSVEVAGSGREGIAKAQASPPDLILCDIGLPEMNGYEIARTLRQDPRLEPTQLVALSGYAAPEDVAKARTAGFDGHLAKPVSLEMLEGILAGLRGDRGSS